MKDLISHKPVVKAIAKFLSTEDLFRFSMVSKRIYYDWTQVDGIVDALDMRYRVQERFGWDARKLGNPFEIVRSRCVKRLVTQLNDKTGDEDDCYMCMGGCGNLKLKPVEVVSPQLSTSVMCVSCFWNRFSKVYIYVEEAQAICFEGVVYNIHSKTAEDKNEIRSLVTHDVNESITCCIESYQVKLRLFQMPGSYGWARGPFEGAEFVIKRTLVQPIVEQVTKELDPFRVFLHHYTRYKRLRLE